MELPGGGIDDPDVEERSVEEACHRRGQVAQDLLDLERRGDEAVDLFQRAEPVTELAGLRVQPGVLDRDGGVVGQPLQHRFVTIGEHSGGAVVDADEALDAITDGDRHHQLGHDALGQHDRHEVPWLADSRVLQPVLGPERSPGGDHASGDAPIGREGEPAVVLVPRPYPVAEREPPKLRIAQRHARHVAGRQLSCALGHALEHGVDVERLVDRARQHGQHLGLATALLGLLVQACIVERERRLIGQGLQALGVGRGEAAGGGIGQRQRAENLALDLQRRRQERADARALEPLAQLVGQRHVGILEKVR